MILILNPLCGIPALTSLCGWVISVSTCGNVQHERHKYGEHTLPQLHCLPRTMSRRRKMGPGQRRKGQAGGTWHTPPNWCRQLALWHPGNATYFLLVSGEPALISWCILNSWWRLDAMANAKGQSDASLVGFTDAHVTPYVRDWPAWLVPLGSLVAVKSHSTKSVVKPYIWHPPWRGCQWVCPELDNSIVR